MMFIFFADVVVGDDEAGCDFKPYQHFAKPIWRLLNSSLSGGSNTSFAP
jgi:hypothetical protein